MTKVPKCVTGGVRYIRYAYMRKGEIGSGRRFYGPNSLDRGRLRCEVPARAQPGLSLRRNLTPTAFLQPLLFVRVPIVWGRGVSSQHLCRPPGHKTPSIGEVVVKSPGLSRQVVFKLSSDHHMTKLALSHSPSLRTLFESEFNSAND